MTGRSISTAKHGRSRSLPGAGSIVVAHLREPREKIWGILIALENPGIWIRGVDVHSFEDWARQVGKDGEGLIAPSTLFLPFLRVEKLVLDEPMGPVPSMAQRLEQMAGVTAEAALEGH